MDEPHDHTIVNATFKMADEAEKIIRADERTALLKQIRGIVERMKELNKNMPVHPQGDEGYDAALQAILQELDKLPPTG
jgi:CHASE3 domain sensor protein